MTREQLVELHGDDELLFADGFDDAILGVAHRACQPLAVLYSYKKCVEILTSGEDPMDYDSAVEYLDFNTMGAYVGERTPVFLMDETSGD